MKYYAIESDNYYNNGSIGNKLFKTKKELHEYMKKEYGCGFQYHKDYDYYYNNEERIWYRPSLMRVYND